MQKDPNRPRLFDEQTSMQALAGFVSMHQFTMQKLQKGLSRAQREAVADALLSRYLPKEAESSPIAGSGGDPEISRIMAIDGLFEQLKDNICFHSRPHVGDELRRTAKAMIFTRQIADELRAVLVPDGDFARLGNVLRIHYGRLDAYSRIN